MPQEAAMNMIDLIIVVCSLAHPDACQEKHLLFEAHGPLYACMWEAQPYLAQWIGEHPDLRIASFRCDWPEHEDRAG
jgi:hypothetical protein